MAKKKFGRINGIIHAAGLIEDMPLARKTHEQFWKVLAPKVRGTLNLHQLTENDPPDFFILFSSLSAVFNNVYQADYSAANSFLDGFSQWRNRRGMKTISINWPGWKETGMAKRVGFTRDAIFRSMPTAQAMELFDVILKKSPVNVIPGIINLDVDYETFLPNYGYTFSRRLQYQWDIEKNKEKTKNTFRENKKIVLIGRTDNRYTEAEKKLGSIMGDTFGLDKIDINSDFYDLGGDSLTAISIYYQLPDIFSLKSQINIEEFVQAGTIKNIAALIEANI